MLEPFILFMEPNKYIILLDNPEQIQRDIEFINKHSGHEFKVKICENTDSIRHASTVRKLRADMGQDDSYCSLYVEINDVPKSQYSLWGLVVLFADENGLQSRCGYFQLFDLIHAPAPYAKRVADWVSAEPGRRVLRSYVHNTLSEFMEDD